MVHHMAVQPRWRLTSPHWRQQLQRPALQHALQLITRKRRRGNNQPATVTEANPTSSTGTDINAAARAAPPAPPAPLSSHYPPQVPGSPLAAAATNKDHVFVRSGKAERRSSSSQSSSSPPVAPRSATAADPATGSHRAGLPLGPRAPPCHGSTASAPTGLTNSVPQRIPSGIPAWAAQRRPTAAASQIPPQAHAPHSSPPWRQPIAPPAKVPARTRRSVVSAAPDTRRAPAFASIDMGALLPSEQAIMPASNSTVSTSPQAKIDPITGKQIVVQVDAVTGQRMVVTAAALQEAQAAAAAIAAGEKLPGSPKVKRRPATAVPEEDTTSRAVPRLVERDGAWHLEDFEEDLRAVWRMTPEYQHRLQSAISAEQVYEAEALRRLYATSSLKRLQRDGLVLLNLSVRRHGILYSSVVYCLHLASNAQLPYHRFRVGDSVMLSEAEGPTSPGAAARKSATSATGGGSGSSGSHSPAHGDVETLDAVVLELRKGHVLVAVEGTAAEEMSERHKQSGVVWRMDQSVKDTTAARQLAALGSLYGVQGGTPGLLWRDPSAVSEKVLRCVLIGSHNSPRIAAQAPLWVTKKEWRDTARAALQSMDGLNSSQRAAVAEAVTRTLTLWQGPPGTGKTRTLLALIDVLVRTSAASADSWSAMQAVLACADTNAAVDNLVAGLHQRGMRVVRVGSPAKVREELRHLTLEALAQATELGQKALELREGAQQTLETFERSLPRSRVLTQQQRNTLDALTVQVQRDRKAADALQRRAAAQVLTRAQVVCCTCTGAGDRSIAERLFRMVVIDEATQATEPAVLIPLMRGAQCVVMAGDPQQLPPTIISQEAYKYGLDITMFERIAQTGVEPLLLNRQYRMHPLISEFPSAHFYGGRLKDAVSADERPLPMEGHEQRTGGGKSGERSAGTAAADPAAGGGTSNAGSYRNLEEAAMALRIVDALLASGDVSSCALLTPYRGQVRALEALLRGPEIAARLGRLADMITVSSVDGYQGQEADVVVFTTVRCNTSGNIGFVSDRRRLNVAVTRPRRGLVVVCSPRTLARGSPDWRNYLAWAREQGCIVPSSGVSRLLRGIDLPASAATAAALLSSDESDDAE